MKDIIDIYLNKKIERFHMLNKMSFVFVLFFCLGMPISTKSVLIGLTVLRSPDKLKTVYLYGDVHLPHIRSSLQAQWIAETNQKSGDIIDIFVEGACHNSVYRECASANANTENIRNEQVSTSNLGRSKLEVDIEKYVDAVQMLKSRLAPKNLYQIIEKRFGGTLSLLETCEDICKQCSDTRGELDAIFTAIKNCMSIASENAGNELMNLTNKLQVGPDNLIIPAINLFDVLLDRFRKFEKCALEVHNYSWPNTPEGNKYKEDLKEFSGMLASFCFLSKEIGESWNKILEDNNLTNATASEALNYLSSRAARFMLAFMKIFDKNSNYIEDRKDSFRKDFPKDSREVKILEKELIPKEEQMEGTGPDKGSMLTRFLYHYCFNCEFAYNILRQNVGVLEKNRTFASLLDVLLMHYIMYQSKKPIIVMYIGDFHREQITKMLENLTWDKLYNKEGSGEVSHALSQTFEQIVDSAIKSLEESYITLDNVEDKYEEILKQIEEKIVQANAHQEVVTQEEIELPLRLG